MRSLVEPVHFVHVRSADESSVQRVGPGVVGALDGFVQPAKSLLQHTCAAVTADVVEPVNLTRPAPNQDQVFTEDVLRKIIAWGRNLALMAHTEPLPGKN